MKKNYKGIIIDLLKSAVSAVVIALFVTNFLFRFVVVNGHSMEPNLHDKAIGISWILPLYTSEPDRFDIVVIKKDNVHLVKRVIGLPNELVQYQNGILTIDGNIVEEKFISDEVKQYTGNFNIQLGEDEYFCMGDNRNHSSDSRVYGPFKRSQLKGDGLFILFGR